MKKNIISISLFLLAIIYCFSSCITNTQYPSTESLNTSSYISSSSIKQTSSDTSSNSTFSVRFLDVGQADAALIECDGHYMLIDGGNVEDSSLIYSVLSNANIRHLDIIVGTHTHEDHIGGLAGALNYATSDLILCPMSEYDSEAFNNFKSYAENQNNGLTIPQVGDIYELGSADIEILGVNSSSDPNNSSIILMIYYGETKFLFTGDAEYEAEQAVLCSGADLSATVLKVGHHGSDTSTSYIWLNAIMPEYAVISVGEDNSYDHPTDAVLSRLRDADVKTYRTDLNGDIVAISDGKNVSISTEKTASEKEIYTASSNSTVTFPSLDALPESSISSEEMLYVLNTNTFKIHYYYCSSVDDMNEANKSYTDNFEDAISQGYSPCGRCTPN